MMYTIDALDAERARLPLGTRLVIPDEFEIQAEGSVRYRLYAVRVSHSEGRRFKPFKRVAIRTLPGLTIRRVRIQTRRRWRLKRWKPEDGLTLALTYSMSYSEPGFQIAESDYVVAHATIRRDQGALDIRIPHVEPSHSIRYRYLAGDYIDTAVYRPASPLSKEASIMAFIQEFADLRPSAFISLEQTA